MKIQVRTVGVELEAFELDAVIEGWKTKINELNERAPPGVGKGIMSSPTEFLNS